MALDLGDRLFAAAYERCLPDSPAAFAWRRHLLRQARGVTVEIGAGTGLNLDAYPREGVTRLVLTEPDHAMARQIAAKASLAAMGFAVPSRMATLGATA